MSEERKYLVQVDKNGYWASGKYREVSKSELDDLVDAYGKKVLSICSNGSTGVMSMWACFKSRISGGCYSDIINAYSLLSDDTKSLVDREHELRHAWKEYEELWRIRYFGSVSEYYIAKAKEAKEREESYLVGCAK